MALAGRAPAAVDHLFLVRLASALAAQDPPVVLVLDDLHVLGEPRATARGDVPAAVAAAQRANPQSVPDAAAALAHALLASGDHQAARRALDAVAEKSQQFGPAGWLVDARLSYGAGDGVRRRRSLERALRLATPERLRLPFAMERMWLMQVLRRDPELAHAHRELLEPNVINPGMVPPQVTPRQAGQAAPVIVERLSQREREVLVHASGMLSTDEIAAEMYLSANTIKTHLRSIYRKLSVAHRSEAIRRARQLQLI